MHLPLSKTSFQLARVLLLISTLSLGAHISLGQTYLGNVEFTSQNALNSWSSSWKSVSGNIYITSLVDNVISNLSPLQNLESVGGSIVISENHSLTALNGLDKLTTVGGIEISFNSTLTNINSLNKLTSVNGSVNVIGNQNLTNLNALNNSLTISGDLTIQNNPKLSQCSVTAVCNFLNNHSPLNYLNVSNNSGSCFNEILLNTACNGSLPVVLDNFEVNSEGPAALLSWTTSQESNVRSFDIQSSKNGFEWQHSGTVKAIGESAASLRYTFVDPMPGEGNHYYRLKMIDFDGSFAYSRVRLIRFSEPEISFFPNPVADRLYARGIAAFKSIEAFDLQGRSLLSVTENPVKGIPVGNWEKGYYLIRIVQQDGSVKKYRVAKN